MGFYWVDSGPRNLYMLRYVRRYVCKMYNYTPVKFVVSCALDCVSGRR